MMKLGSLVVGAALLASGAAYSQSLNGRSFQIGDNGTATFGANGDYTFVRHGKWVAQGDRVCITFDNGQLLCSPLAWQGQPDFFHPARREDCRHAGSDAIARLFAML